MNDYVPQQDSLHSLATHRLRLHVRAIYQHIYHVHLYF